MRDVKWQEKFYQKDANNTREEQVNIIMQIFKDIIKMQ